MTYQQAISVRTLQLAGVKMLDSVVQEAIEVIRTTCTVTPWPTYGDGAAEARRDLVARGFRDALQAIAGMDPAGQRADDLGRAARAARDALDAFGAGVNDGR